MAYQNKLLFRDDTNDDGSTPSHGGTYQSPDIISHDQIADPQTELSGSYARDVNQQVSSGSKTNFVYTRVTRRRRRATSACTEPASACS